MACGNKDYTPLHYGLVFAKWIQLNRSGNVEKAKESFKEWLNSRYKSGDADNIYDAVLEGSFSPEFKSETRPQNVDLVQDDLDHIVTSETKDEAADNYYVETQDLSTASYFTEGVHSDDYKNVVSKFNARIVRDLIYDKNSGRGVGDANAPTQSGMSVVNIKLRQFRKDLLNKLWATISRITGKPFKVEVNDDTDGDQFARQVGITLAQFKRLHTIDQIKNDGKGISAEEYDTYVTLACFDKLLKNFGIVSIRNEYRNTNSIPIDKYVYVGQTIKYDQTYGKEDANIDDYTSPLVKIVLDQIQGETSTGAPTGTISLDGFKATMNGVIEWAWLSFDTRNINGRLTTPRAEIAKGADADWEGLLGAFLEKHGPVNGFYNIDNFVRGLKKHVFGKNMPKKVRSLFIAQALNTVHSAYLEYTTEWKKDHSEVVRKLASDKLVDRSMNILKGRIRSKVDFFRTNQSIFKKYSKDFNLHKLSDRTGFEFNVSTGPDRQATITVVLDTQNSSFDITRSDGVPISDWDDSNIKPIIELFTDIYLPDDLSNYQNILQTKNVAETMMPVMAVVVCATLYPNNTKLFKNNAAGLIDLYTGPISFNQELTNAAIFLNSVYGYQATSVVHNVNGDNLPASQLGSMFYRTQDIISEVQKSEANPLKSNICVQNPGAIKGTNIREGIAINGTIKSIETLTPSEVSYVSIVHDFWKPLVNSKANNQEETVIDSQPMTYSDKKRQMTKAVDLSEVRLFKNGKSIGNLVSYIKQLKGFGWTGNTRNTNVQNTENLLRDVMLDYRGGYTKRATVNLLNKFANILGIKDRISFSESTYADIIALKDKINDKLKSKSLEQISALARSKNIDLYNETDVVSRVGGGLAINPMLMAHVDRYLSSPEVADNYIRRQKFLFAKDLIGEDFVISKLRDGSIRGTFDEYAKTDPSWIDNYSGSIKLFKIRDINGNLIDDTNLNNVDHNYGDTTQYQIELNPILNSFFYQHLIVGHDLKTLHFGESWQYAGIKEYDPDNYNEELDENIRFITQTKRAVIGGGTVKLMIPARYGISKTLRMAAFEDIEAPVNDMTGDHHNEKVSDGAIYMAPEEAIMENWSLGDGSVGENFKKSLYGWVDENGTLNEIKTAAFTLSNENRRKNPLSRTFNAEKAFYLTHKDNFETSFIDLKDFYNPNGSLKHSRFEQDRLITHGSYIYFYDNNSGKYYKIVRIQQNPDSVVRTLQEVDLYDNNIGTEFTETTPMSFKSFYDLDQIFGGAWCMVYDDTQDQLVYSNANNQIAAKIMCEHDVKDKILHYLVQHSAMKVGVKNMNDSSVFRYGNRSDWEKQTLWEFAFNPKYTGVQMDATTGVEGGHVTEMSQMIVSLIQDGYLVDIVKAIYDGISDVTSAGIAKYTSADESAVIQAISDALIKSISTGAGNIASLADSFVKQAADNFNKYHIEMRLPFSYPTLKNKFVSVILSTINKNSLRRRYPGLHSVQAPGYGMMQYFRTPDGKITTFKKYSDILRNSLPEGQTLEDAFVDRNAPNDNVVTNDYVRTWLSNPNVIQEIDVKNIDYEDTILVLNDKGNYDIIKIDDIEKKDRYKNLRVAGDRVYRWNTQGRDLVQQQSRYSVGDYTYDLYDFDVSRRCFYLSDFMKKIKKPSLKIEAEEAKAAFIKRKYNIDVNNAAQLIEAYNAEKALLRETFVEYSEALKKGSTYDTYQDSFISHDAYVLGNTLRSIFAAQGAAATMNFISRYLSDNPTAEGVTTLREAVYTLNDADKQVLYAAKEILKVDNAKLEKPKVSFAQIIMGRAFAKKFGLKSGVSVDDVLNDPKYFETQLKSYFQKPSGQGFNKLYDVALYNSNGDIVYVTVGNNNITSNRWTNISKTSDKFQIIDNDLKYCGDTLCNADGIQYGEYLDNETGKVYNMLYVRDVDTLNKIRNSDFFSIEKYNYNKDNWKDLVKVQYAWAVDKNGYIKRDFSINGYKFAAGYNISDKAYNDQYNTKAILDALRVVEGRQYDRTIKKLAKNKRRAFEKSLKMVGARIPSQSMQSYSGVEVIDFTDSDENEVYLPRVLTWIAGSK